MDPSSNRWEEIVDDADDADIDDGEDPMMQEDNMLSHFGVPENDVVEDAYHASALCSRRRTTCSRINCPAALEA